MKGDEIPDGSILYRYIKPEAVYNGELSTGIFDDPNLSCDWQKLLNDPTQSPHVKVGNKLIIEITVCEDIRNPRNPKSRGRLEPAWRQDIIHDPSKDIVYGEMYENDAHSLIKGPKRQPVREALVANSKLRNS